MSKVKTWGTTGRVEYRVTWVAIRKGGRGKGNGKVDVMGKE